jgi:hypothetical protein
MWFNRKNARPTKSQVAGRFIALRYVVAYAIIAPPRELLDHWRTQWTEDEQKEFTRSAEERRDDFWTGLRSARGWRNLSPREIEFSRATIVTMTDRQLVDAAWRMESAYVLLWALNFVAGLPCYDTQAGPEIFSSMPFEPAQLLAHLRTAALRDSAEIDEAREIAELWHWRSRTRQLIEDGTAFEQNELMTHWGYHSYDDIVRHTANSAASRSAIPDCIEEDFPAKGKPYRDLTADEWSEVTSIAVERHFALNWLCGYSPRNQWDETPTDT